MAELIKTHLTLAAATAKINNENSWNFYHTLGACIISIIKKKFDNQSLQTSAI